MERFQFLSRRANTPVEGSEGDKQAISSEQDALMRFLTDPLNEQISNDIQNLLLTIQNHVEHFTFSRSEIEEYNDNGEVKVRLTQLVVDTPVELRRINKLGIESIEDIKKHTGEKEHIRLIIGTKTFLGDNNPVADQLMEIITHFASKREARLIPDQNDQPQNTSSTAEQDPTRTPPLDDSLFAEDYITAEYARLKEAKKNGFDCNGRLEKPTFSVQRLKGATLGKIHSLIIFKNPNADEKDIHIWIANQSLDRVIGNTKQETIKTFKPLLGSANVNDVVFP
jgi:hypothetical protein